MALLLRRHGFVLPEGDLPASPVKVRILDRLLATWYKLRRSPFELLRRVVMVNLNPPPGVKAINNALQEDPELRKSNASKH